MNPPVRQTFFILLATVLISTLMWLDSLDGYLNARYHFQLTDYLPEELFTPSRSLASLFNNTSDDDAQLVTTDASSTAGSAPVPTQSGAPEVASSTVVNPLLVKHTHKAPPVASSEAVEVTAQGGVLQSSPASSQSAIASGSEEPRILFAGDSMMQGVAPFVIASLRKTYPNGYFSDQSKQSTGLTVRRYFDWPTKIKEEILKQKFQAVIIFLGPNDPWDIYEKGAHYVFPSEKWEDKYRSRVKEVLDFCKEHNVDVIWLGLPNMRDDRIKQGALVENKVFQEETAQYGFEFFPTENLVGHLSGPFDKQIDDPVKGRIVVRADDGIHFTPTGLRIISTALVASLKTRWTQ